MPDTLTHSQQAIIERLRDIDAQIFHLTRVRAQLRGQLEAAYSPVHAPAPKVPGTVLSVFNYRQQGFTGRVHTTSVGLKLLNTLDNPVMRIESYIILTLCTRESGADIEKLLNVPEISSIPRLRSTLHRLVRDNYLEATFTLEAHN